MPKNKPVGLAKWLILLLLMLFVGCVAFWWIESDRIDLESARQSLSVIIQTETTIFALTIAGLAFVSSVLSNQSKRLDRLRESWLKVLVQTGEPVLKDIEKIYHQKLEDEGSLPFNFKYAKISHLSDGEILRYLPALIGYREAAAANNLVDLEGDVRDLDADSMLLFRISCAVLFADAWEAYLKTHPIAQLSHKLNDMDRADNIIMLVNNIYDSRLAASRGLPIFVFFTLASIAMALAILSVMSYSTFSIWLYGLAMFPITIIILFAGYYISEILRRYF